MNNFEKLKSMSMEALTDWFDKYIAFDNAPYMFWFDQKYCKNCEPIMCKIFCRKSNECRRNYKSIEVL